MRRPQKPLLQLLIKCNALKNSYLGSWASQGVLCLNTSLTVRAHEANSHSNKGWETFTDAVLKLVDQYGGSGLSAASGGVVFLAWGAGAGKRVAKLSKTKHCILTSAVRDCVTLYRECLRVVAGSTLLRYRHLEGSSETGSF